MAEDIRKTPNGKLEVRISVRDQPKTTAVLVLRGEIDNEGAELLKTVLDEFRKKRLKYIVISASELKKVSSAGISVLLAHKSLSLVGGPKISLVATPDCLRFPLEQLGAISLFPMFDDIGSALQSLESE